MSKVAENMPRFYFHVRKGSDFEEDSDGAELPSAEAARGEALLAAREILAERLLRGEVIDGDVFEITTEDGDVVGTVPFKSVIKLD